MKFDSAYEENVSAVYGYLAYRVRSAEEAEDLTQETFERALGAWSRFDPRTILVEPLDNGCDFDGIEGILHARRNGSDGTMEVEIDPAGDPQRIMRDIVARSRVRSIELRRLSLEEVFVRLVRDDVGEQEAEIVREELSHG